MIYCQEVNDNLYDNIPDRYDSLPIEMKTALRKKVCNKCNKELSSEGKIHYVVLSNGKVMWWHNYCVLYRRKK